MEDQTNATEQTSAATTAADAANESTEAKQTDHQEETYSRADLDRETTKRVENALAKAKADWQKELDQAKADAKSEGEKYAKMTAEEKAKAKFEAEQKALEKRKAELDRRELAAGVKDTLTEKQLPVELADSLVVLGDAEKIHAVLDTISTTIEKKVADGVKERLRQDPPKNGASPLEGSDDPFMQKLNKYK